MNSEVIVKRLELSSNMDRNRTTAVSLEAPVGVGVGVGVGTGTGTGTETAATPITTTATTKSAILNKFSFVHVNGQRHHPEPEQDGGGCHQESAKLGISKHTSQMQETIGEEETGLDYVGLRDGNENGSRHSSNCYSSQSGYEVVDKYLTPTSTTSTSTSTTTTTSKSDSNQKEVTTRKDLLISVTSSTSTTSATSANVIVDYHDIWRRFIHEFRRPHPSSWFTPIDFDFYQYYESDVNVNVNGEGEGEGDGDENMNQKVNENKSNVNNEVFLNREESVPNGKYRYPSQLRPATNIRLIDIDESFAPAKCGCITTVPLFLFCSPISKNKDTNGDVKTEEGIDCNRNRNQEYYSQQQHHASRSIISKKDFAVVVAGVTSSDDDDDENNEDEEACPGCGNVNHDAEDQYYSSSSNSTPCNVNCHDEHSTSTTYSPNIYDNTTGTRTFQFLVLVLVWKAIATTVAITTFAFGIHNVALPGFYFAYLTHWGILFCTLYHVMSFYHSMYRFLSFTNNRNRTITGNEHNSRKIVVKSDSTSSGYTKQTSTPPCSKNESNCSHEDCGKRKQESSHQGALRIEALCQSNEPISRFDNVVVDDGYPSIHSKNASTSTVDEVFCANRSEFNSSSLPSKKRYPGHKNIVSCTSYECFCTGANNNVDFDHAEVVDKLDVVPMSVRVTWILFELGSHTAAGAAVVFWPLVIFKPHNYDIQYNIVANHGFVLLLTLIDGMVINRIPFRVMHWYLFLLPFDVLYMVWTIIHDLVLDIGNPDLNDNDPTTNDDALYRNVLEWKTSWPIALTTSFGIVFLLGPTVFITFWILSIYPIQRVFQLMLSLISCICGCCSSKQTSIQVNNNKSTNDDNSNNQTTNILRTCTFPSCAAQTVPSSQPNDSIQRLRQHDQLRTGTRLRYVTIESTATCSKREI